MRIANYIHDSIEDGPGLRFVVFVQGCSHNCPGCHNPDTHDPDGGREVNVLNLVEEMLKNPLCEGLTISGGEPFDQAVETSRLALWAQLKDKTVWTTAKAERWVKEFGGTGYRFEDLLKREDPFVGSLIRCSDVLVDGPFIQSMKSYEAKFRGSTNQRLIDVQKSLEEGRVVLWEPEPTCEQLRFEVPES